MAARAVRLGSQRQAMATLVTVYLLIFKRTDYERGEGEGLRVKDRQPGTEQTT